MMEVNSCCYFISLKTGAKLIGFVAMVGCLFLAIISSFEMIFVLRHLDRSEFVSTIWELVLDILLQVIHMAASCCMIVGVYQAQASLVRPWLVTSILAAVLGLFFSESIVVRFFVPGNFPMLSLRWIFFSALMLVDDIYGWLIVFSYYRSIVRGAHVV